MDLHRVNRVEADAGTAVRITFEDGTAGVINFDPVVREGGVYAPLGDEDVFRQFRIERGGRVLAWPGGIEFCADALWQAVSKGSVLASAGSTTESHEP